MPTDETFWGGLGQLALKTLAIAIAALSASLAALVLATPFIA